MSTPEAEQRRQAFLAAVTTGGGRMAWQPEGTSDAEARFRAEQEARKTQMLATAAPGRRPALVSEEQLARARRNVQTTAWGAQWLAGLRQVCDHACAQPAEWVERMISPLTPANPYAWHCPHCVGRLSQVSGGTLYRGTWDYREPDVIRCRFCGQVYPDERYPETAVLWCPRQGQTFTFYLNEAERAQPDDHSGRLAWPWAGNPVHVSFTGIIRTHQVLFMLGLPRQLALVSRLTGEERYAQLAKAILCRLAGCFPHWLYHDYWDTFADCDPLFAAWHDGYFQYGLELEWKRNLCLSAYREDRPGQVRILANQHGAGRITPVAEGNSFAVGLALAYDLTADLVTAKGAPLWPAAEQELVARDLLMEMVMTGEPFVGGAGQALATDNKAPSVYGAMAAVARSLGVAAWARVALLAYERLRDRAFAPDGSSHECSLYTGKYLGEGMLLIPELLAGFANPATGGRAVDLFREDPKLRQIMSAYAWQHLPDARYLPTSDTPVDQFHYPHLLELGAQHYPEVYAGVLPLVYRHVAPGERAALNFTAEQVAATAPWKLPELWFPDWGLALLRHGQGPGSTVLSLACSPAGGHRHHDHLALYYRDRGQAILGDLGYVCDTPHLSWIHSTFSHNLVIVDDAEQRWQERQPAFETMFATPSVSAVGAGSTAYAQCREYRRLVLLLKGPDGASIVVDVFRVKGGKKHVLRVFSELGASDADGNGRVFAGLDLAPDGPLPDFGGSTAPEHIFGLREARAAAHPVSGWQATWQQRGAAYRLWALSPCDRAEAAHGPAQEQLDQTGRRARFLDLVNEGADVTSTFVLVHEPARGTDALPIRQVTRLPTPAAAGPDAVALHLTCAWGDYLVVNAFAQECEVAGTRFAGTLGILGQTPEGRRWLVASGAATLQHGAFGFTGAPAAWTGTATVTAPRTLVAAAPRPADFPELPPGCENYVRVQSGDRVLGFPVDHVGERGMVTRCFDLPALTGAFSCPALHVMADD